MFTGDRSGIFLYTALHEAGYANQAESDHIGDGLTLRDIAITAAAHCAPPANKPLPEEMANCSEDLVETFASMPNGLELGSRPMPSSGGPLARMRSRPSSGGSPSPIIHGV